MAAKRRPRKNLKKNIQSIPLMKRYPLLIVNQHCCPRTISGRYWFLQLLHLTMQLLLHLPSRFRFVEKWYLLYGTQVHGISLNTFYSRVKDEGPSILLVKDKNNYVSKHSNSALNIGQIFGGFASESWRIETHFYGSGESFLFTLEPKTAVFHWANKQNKNFLCSRRDFIAMGGGYVNAFCWCWLRSNHFGLWLDSDLDKGSSSPSETFGNPCLASSEDFEISVVEVWGFEEPSSPDFVSTHQGMQRFSWL